MAEILWVGGWASDLGPWGPALAALYPGHRHRFLDAHAVLDGNADLRAEAARLPADGCLAAWSLGSLLAHRALADGWVPACRILSLCPIFDFCRADGPWPRAAVLRMARRLVHAEGAPGREGAEERGKVLSEFRTAAWGNSKVTEGMAGAWRDREAAYTEASLARGLETLASVHLAEADVPAPAGLLFLASPADPLSPAPPSAAADPRWRPYPGGHLPFLDFSHLVAPLLSGADRPR
jgi:hypothetical protein